MLGATSILLCALGQAAETARTATAAEPVETIVVRARAADARRLAPRPSQMVDLEDRPLRIETLGDVVAELPGVALFRQGGLGASQFLSIRGADFDQTVVLVDDVPITGPDRGAVDLSLFPLDGFARLEIFRGSAPIRYGGGTIGGVVRLVPKDAGTERVAARGTVAAFDTQQVEVEGEGGAGPFGLVAAAGGLRSENDFVYLDDQATFADPTDDAFVERENAFVRQGHGFLSGTWSEGPHRLAALAFALHQDRGLPGPATVVSRESAQQRTRFFGSLGYRVETLLGEQPLDAFATLAFGWDHDRVQDPLGRVGLGREDTRDTYLSLDVRAGAFLDVLPGLTAGTTFFYRRDDIRPENRFALPGDQPSERDLGVLAGELTYRTHLAEIPALLRGSVSLQLTQARVRAGGRDASLEEAVPNFRLEARMGPLRGFTASALLTSGSKLPTTLQLFGNRDTIVPSPELGPERSLSLDGGLRYDGVLGPVDLGAEARLFWMTIEDIIVARRTAQNTVAFRNERDGETVGVEAGLEAELPGALALSASLTWLDAQFDYLGFERQQSLRVPLRLFSRLAWQLPGAWSGLELFGELDHRSPFFADTDNQVQQPALTLAHAGLQVRSAPSGLRVAVAVRNLFDAMGFDLLAFPRPGRAFEISLAWEEILL